MTSAKSAIPRYNSIHRQQLFHWIGRHIDSADGKNPLQRTKQREAYVKCLRDALEKGIWLKVPQKPDQLGDGSIIKVTRPIACFTEWSLGQSLPHTTEYGRLGLGFAKKFILSRGGQPVTYVQDAQKNAPYSAALLTIGRLLKDERGGIPTKLRVQLAEHFEFISHFAKRIQAPALVITSKKKLTIPKRKDGIDRLLHAALTIGIVKMKEAMAQEKAFVRKFGRFLHYLEEREWRIVYDLSLEKYFESGPGAPNGPEYYLQFEPGAELFTVVLPDNQTVNLAMQDPFIRKNLFPKDAPHVTLLSLQDIGTF